jgi:outer membrane protein assembly factor BamA
MNLSLHIVSWTFFCNNVKQKSFLLLLILIPFLNQSYGQKTLLYQIENGKIKKQKFTDTTEIGTYINKKLNRYFERGYLNAQVDTNHSNNKKLQINYSLGEKYYWNKLSVKNTEYLPPRILNKIEKLEGKTLNFSELDKIKELSIQHFENNGYPFASIYTDSVKFEHNKINLKFDPDQKTLIRFDSLKYNNEIRVSYLYLSNYTGIKHFEPYNENATKN